MEELYRNIFLAYGCIFLTTLIMLTSVVACLQVLLACVLTLLNVNGGMYFWGKRSSVLSSHPIHHSLMAHLHSDISIDPVSSTMLIISIGICVDYSAHIAHHFLSAKGE